MLWRFRAEPTRRVPVTKARRAQPAGTAQLEQFLTQEEAELVHWLTHTWSGQQQAVSYSSLIEGIVTGQLSTEYIEQWQQDYSKLVVDVIAPKWERAIQTAARHVTEKFGGPVLDTTLPHVDGWVKAHGAEFVTGITSVQRESMQAMLRRAAMAYDTFGADELARAIRPTIGLTQRQSQAALNFYARARENGASEEQAETAQLRYAARMHRARAQIIADFELATAYNQGNQLAVEQLQREGMIGQATKTWMTDATESVCDVCGALDGVSVELNEDFPIKGKGVFRRDLPPIHPHCHCCVAYDVEPIG